MTQTMNDMKVMCDALMSIYRDLPALREKLRTCKVEDVLDVHTNLVATLMTASNLVASIIELEPNADNVTCLWLMQANISDEIVRLTEVNSVAATVGR